MKKVWGVILFSLLVVSCAKKKAVVLESGSLDRLEERVRYAIPELLSLDKTTPKYLDMTFLSQRHERMLVNG